MGCCGIMRIEKRGRASVYGLQLEATRTEADHEAGRDFDRSDIDWGRTHENVRLVETVGGWNAAITQQLHAAGVKERKDSIVMLDAVYTASPQWFAEHTKDEAVAFFKDALSFHAREYCGGDGSRVLSAVIHFDETTPHMQVASVPLVEDERGVHLSAKIVCGSRADYRRRQDRFFEQVSKKYDLERGEIHDDLEKKKHTTKREWEAAKAAECLAVEEGKLRTVQEKVRKQEVGKLVDEEAARQKAKLPTVEVIPGKGKTLFREAVPEKVVVEKADYDRLAASVLTKEKLATAAAGLTKDIEAANTDGRVARAEKAAEGLSIERNSWQQKAAAAEKELSKALYYEREATESAKYFQQLYQEMQEVLQLAFQAAGELGFRSRLEAQMDRDRGYHKDLSELLQEGPEEDEYER